MKDLGLNPDTATDALWMTLDQSLSQPMAKDWCEDKMEEEITIL